MRAPERSAAPPLAAAPAAAPAADAGAALRGVTAGLVGAVVLLGLHWPVMKVALDHVTPLWFSVLRQVGGVLVMIPLLAVLGRLALPGKADLPIVLGVGLLQIAGTTSLSMIGLLYLEPGRAAILCYTTPFWITVATVIFLRARPSAVELLGLGLGLAGTLLLVRPGSIDWSDPGQTLGVVILLLAAALWSAAIMQTRHHRWVLDPLQLLPFMMLAATAGVVPFALWHEGWPPAIAWNTTSVLALIFTTLSTCFSVWAISVAGRRMNSVAVALSLLGVPALGLGFSALWLGEAVTPEKLASLGLVLAGSAAGILAAHGRRPR